MFGKVVDGKDVVKAIESRGSLIGKTGGTIIITSSGVVDEE